jgi:hypothetical protein
LHREAEAVFVYHAVSLLPPMPRAKRRNTQSGTRITHPPHGWSGEPRAPLRCGAGRCGSPRRRGAVHCCSRLRRACDGVRVEGEGGTHNVSLEVDGAQDVDDALRIVRLRHHLARLASAPQHRRAPLRHCHRIRPKTCNLSSTV